MRREDFRRAAREFEEKARDAVDVDDKIDLYRKASMQYHKAGDGYACEMLVSAASEALRVGDFERVLELHMDAGKLSYELGSDDIFWYLDVWWVAKKLGKSDELGAAVEKTLKRGIERAANRLSEENRSDDALEYASRIYGLLANYHKTKLDFDGYLLNAEKAIDFLLEKSVVDDLRIAENYSIVANNVYIVRPKKGVELFDRSISHYEKQSHSATDIKEVLVPIRSERARAVAIETVKLSPRARVHPLLLEYMFRERTTDPFSVLSAITKDANKASETLQYLKLLEAERMNAIVGETHLLIGNFTEAERSYKRAVENIEFLFYFADTTPEENAREIRRAAEYNVISGKIKYVLGNLLDASQHYLDAGENMELIKDYERALEYYETGLKYALAGRVSQEKLDRARRRHVAEVEEKIAGVKEWLER